MVKERVVKAVRALADAGDVAGLETFSSENPIYLWEANLMDYVAESAAEQLNWTLLEWALEHGAQPHAALESAACEGATEFVAKIYEHVKGSMLRTALIDAARFGHNAVTSWAIAHGAHGIRDALLVAEQEGHKHTVDDILKLLGPDRSIHELERAIHHVRDMPAPKIVYLKECLTQLKA